MILNQQILDNTGVPDGLVISIQLLHHRFQALTYTYLLFLFGSLLLDYGVVDRISLDQTTNKPARYVVLRSYVIIGS